MRGSRFPRCDAAALVVVTTIAALTIATLAIAALVAAAAPANADDPSGSIRFRRGDVNADGSTDVADVAFLLDRLFRVGEVLPCRLAADINDDGRIDLSDGISLLSYHFRAGPPPPAPFPGCGPDPTPDELPCARYSRCGRLALAWDAPATNEDGSVLDDLAGFVLHIGTVPRSEAPYRSSIDVGLTTSFTLTGLDAGRVFVAVTAYDESGNESDFSEEVSAIVE